MSVAIDRLLDPMSDPTRVVVAEATDSDRTIIYRIRHEVYAKELRQHPENPAGALRDTLDGFNTYIVAKVRGELAGFVSITPPHGEGYSVDKYFHRRALPFPLDDGVYETRILTVSPGRRGWILAGQLMYAAFRWIESRGGRRVIAIGREEILGMYRKIGFQPSEHTTRAGDVTYRLMSATIDELGGNVERRSAGLRRLEAVTDWRLPIPFHGEAVCRHGGAFFDAIGTGFETLERREGIIGADVLDAWFPPSPRVLDALHRHGAWLLATSPPTRCEGLVAAIAEARGVAPESVLPGAGSSDLIFRALRHWACPASRVLVMDPSYGEYGHVLERVIGCRVDRMRLSRADGYVLDPEELAMRLRAGYDLVVLVNPNSPTGCHVPGARLTRVIGQAPRTTRFWIDETYVEYAGSGQSLERFAAATPHVVVCKSMSKAYALSGARVAYLCAHPRLLEGLRPLTPPWNVSLPGQVAAVEALRDPLYYAARYAQTQRLRQELLGALERLGFTEISPSRANFLLVDVPPCAPPAATVIHRCRRQGLFLRDPSSMGGDLGPRALRVAVKDEATNGKMIRILADAVADGDAGA